MKSIGHQPSVVLEYYRLIYQKLFSFLSKSWGQVLLIVILGATLRLINLGQQPYWGDEAFPAGVLRHYRNFGDLLQYISLIEYYPPLSYILLHFWSGIFGDSVLAMRLPSMIFGTLVIWIVYFLGQTMFRGRRVGIYAALIVAVLPIQIHFSQSIRPYIMIELFGLLGILAYVYYSVDRNYYYLILYVLSFILGIYTHYAFLFTLVPLAFFWFLVDALSNQESRWHNLTVWLLVHTAIFLGFYPWLKFFFYKLIFHNYELFSLLRPLNSTKRSLSFFSMTLDQLIWLTKGLLASQIEVASIWLFKLILVAVIVYLFLAKTEQIRRLFKDSATTLALLAWMIVVPVTLFVFSGFSVSYTQVPQQHIIIVSIMIIMLLAIVFDQASIKLRLLLLSLFLASLLTFAVNVLGDDSLWDYQYRLKDVAEFVNGGYREGDIVISGYNILRTDLNYYLRSELSTIGFFPTNYYGIDFMNSRDTMGLVEIEFHFRIGQPTQSELFARMDQLVKINKPKRIWFTLFLWPAWLENWAKDRGWHKQISLPQDLIPLELYTKLPENK